MNRTEWWIDYVEGESTPTEEQDMNLLLGNSREHRAIFQGYKATREAIKSLDPTRPPGGDDFYNNLHSNIMASLEKTPVLDEANPTHPPEVSKVRSTHLRSK